MLRYQPSLGPAGATQMSQYLSMPVVPTYLGFDPRIQVVHERDALDALIAAVRNPVPGPVNVAAEGTIGLTRMIRKAGKLSIPIISPLFTPSVDAARRLGLFRFSPDFRQLLRYGRGIDVSRLIEEVGFRPAYSMEAAVADYVATQQGRRMTPTVRQAVASR